MTMHQTMIAYAAAAVAGITLTVTGVSEKSVPVPVAAPATPQQVMPPICRKDPKDLPPGLARFCARFQDP